MYDITREKIIVKLRVVLCFEVIVKYDLTVDVRVHPITGGVAYYSGN